MSTLNEIVILDGQLDGSKVVRQDDKFMYTVSWTQKNEMFILSATVKNITATQQELQVIYPYGMIKITDTQLTHAYLECQSLLGEVGAHDLTNGHSHVSYGMVGLMQKRAKNGILLGYTDVNRHFCQFSVQKVNQQVCVTPYIPFEGKKIQPMEEVTVEKIAVLQSKPLSVLLSNYAKMLAVGQNVRADERVKTGWCSWYQYYSTETREDILENARQLSQSPLKDTLQVILLDDGWNLPDNSHPCVWGDWQAGGKFPLGMKEMADRIHETGFDAGIWLAPFAVAKDSQLYKEHREWLVGANNELATNDASVFGLDLTHPGAQQFLRDTFSRVFDEWGYDYIKIDFLLYGVTEGKRYDENMTTVESLRKGMEIINECAKGKFILACGTPVLQLIGLCDGMRIGADVGGQWYFPLNEGPWPMGNCAMKPAFRYTVFRHWQHGAFWQNDPDCLIVRDECNGIEDKMFHKFFPQLDVQSKNFGLTDNEAMCFVKLLWFTGGMWFLSEEWKRLTIQRQEFVELCTESNKNPVCVADEYSNKEVLVMRSVQDASQFGVFNISDEQIEMILDNEIIPGLQGEYVEKFDKECLIDVEGNRCIVRLDPHSACVFEKINY